MFRVRQRVDVRELARRLAHGARILGALPLGDEPALLDKHHIHEAYDARQQKCQLIGAVGAVLVQCLQHPAVGEGAQCVQQAIDHRQDQRQRRFGVAVVAGLLPCSPQVIVLPGLHDAQTDDTHAYQCCGGQLRRHQLAQAAGGQRQHRHQCAAGIADGGGDGQLDIPQADVADGHRADVQQGHRQIRQDDAAVDLRAVDKNLIGGVQTHHQAHCHHHFKMAVFVVCVLAADLAEQVRAAPADQCDQRKPKPHKKLLILSCIARPAIR